MTATGRSPPYKKNLTGRLTTLARYFLTMDTQYSICSALTESPRWEGGEGRVEKTRKKMRFK